MEKLSPLKEGTAWAKNQAVLNSLDEDANGNLTYKGKEIGSERATDYVDFTYDDNIQTIEEPYGSFSVVVGLFTEPHPNFPAGTEIADVQVQIPEYNEGEMFSLKDMIAFDRTPYISLVHKVYYDTDYTSNAWLRLMFFTSQLTGIGEALANYGYTSIRIIYYKD